MKTSLRLMFYILLALVSVVLIQRQKGVINKSKEVVPTSVLGVLLTEGVPVETYTVEPTEIMQYMRKTLEDCGLKLCFYATSIEKNKLRVGDPIFSEGVNKLIGHIFSIDQTDITTGLSRINVIQDSGLNKKKIEFSVVSIGTSKIKNILSVPTSSIEYDTDSAFVWLYNGGQPKKRKIETGIQSIVLTQVKSGLSIGDIVVSKGQGLLHLYDKAQIIKNNSK